MAFDVTALAAYVEQEDFALMSQMQATGGMQDIATIQVGLKESSAVQLFETDVIFQASSCTRTPSGTSTFSQRIITVGGVDIHEDLCVKNLNGYWTQKMVASGCMNEADLPQPIEQLYVSDKLNGVQNALDVADWQGLIGSPTNNLSYYDGWIEIIDTAAASVDGNPTGITVATGITEANVISILQGMWKLIPENILEETDLYFFLGSDVYRCYVNALINANLFHFIGEDGIPTLFGTDVKISRQVGLTGTDRIFLGRGSNFILGMDGASDEDEFRLELDPVSKKSVLFDMCFKRGTQVYYPDEIVEFTLVP
jgi:hypothetical protein